MPAVVAWQGAPPPNDAPPTGLILGQTVDGTTGKPVGGVIVSLNGGGPSAAAPTLAPGELPARLPQSPHRVVSDGQGHFVFHGLPQGVYTLSGTKNGYADTAFGRRSASDLGGRPIVLRDGELRGDLSLPIWRMGTVSGTVVDEAGEPLIGVQVQVLQRSTSGGRVRFRQEGTPTTDDRGVYRVSVAPGSYLVGVVSTQATVPMSLVAAMDNAVQADDRANLRNELMRSYGVGAVRVTSGGQRVGSWLLQTPGFSVTGGEGLALPVRGNRVSVYPTVYYPSAATPADASLVTVGSGEDRAGVDFQLQPVPGVGVSGTLSGPNGPEPNTAIDLVPPGADALQRDDTFQAAATVTDGSGAFVFLGVPAGTYAVRVLKMPRRPTGPPRTVTVIRTAGGGMIASSTGGPAPPPPIPEEPTLWATMPLTVGNQDLDGLALLLHEGARVSGQIRFDGSAAPPASERVRLMTVQVEPADGRTTSPSQVLMGRGVFDVNGQFNTYQFPPGRYVVRALGALPGWTFDRAELNGQNVTDSPLEIGGRDVTGVSLIFTDRPAGLSGTVRSTQGTDADATVVVLPEQPSLWTDYGQTPRRLRTTDVRTDGRYTFSNLPAGDYLVVALHSPLPADWLAESFLSKIAGLGTRVPIGNGEHPAQDLEAKEVQ